MTIQDILLSLGIGTAGSLVAAVLLRYRVFDPLVRDARLTIEAIVNPVTEIRSLEELARLVSAAVMRFDGRRERLLLFRALPCELSDALVEHMYAGNDPLCDSAKRDLLVYHELVKRVVQEGRGCFDESVFGRTGKRAVDRGTLNSLRDQYFLSSRGPDTSVVGFHRNLDEIGIILLGEAERNNDPRPAKWSSGFLVAFSEALDRCHGFEYRVHSHIQNLEFLFRQKRSDACQAASLLRLSSSLDADDLACLERAAATFFESGEFRLQDPSDRARAALLPAASSSQSA